MTIGAMAPNGHIADSLHRPYGTASHILHSFLTGDTNSQRLWQSRAARMRRVTLNQAAVTQVLVGLRRAFNIPALIADSP